MLTYIVEKTISEENCHQAETKQFVNERLHLYQNQLFADISVGNIDEKNGARCLTAFSMPWRNKYRFMLVSDVEQIVALLQNDREIEKKYLIASAMIHQYRANREFIAKSERRIIVTANMSAGKSTLINALIGKPIARTSQEVCTGNVCYLFNKAYEDDKIHLSTQGLNLNATAEDLHS